MLGVGPLGKVCYVHAHRTTVILDLVNARIGSSGGLCYLC